ncbi:hypothetical protein Ssi03_08140 [Sphaerisporangium siamense]|uniref:Uncharacterized protein YuzE n=1 Tax=Sphaerisporangium siamense TaxID=795645 RepID=A0A7W7GEV9_9ACTN|nr:DUF2283 domain-containing protein [Sphaerisporangium siamense]MBB4705789.1 uncharacterized protein YuzE [Sphaerisporangium siamense]GII82824.1 hypothetical protein Ssi03_08140 [Sphaerisporangium siamense]
MRIEYDQENDVAYVYLVDHIGQGEAGTQIPVEAGALRGEVILDLDAQGLLLGVEIIGASQVLRPELLAQAHDPEEF